MNAVGSQLCGGIKLVINWTLTFYHRRLQKYKLTIYLNEWFQKLERRSGLIQPSQVPASVFFAYIYFACSWYQQELLEAFVPQVAIILVTAKSNGGKDNENENDKDNKSVQCSLWQQSVRVAMIGWIILNCAKFAWTQGNFFILIAK